MSKKALLMILDGWGLGDQKKDDVIFNTPTPYWDYLMSTYPHSQLQASGENVGLPDGQMGNSEVGHLNIGAGRVVYQDLVKINRACADNSIMKNPEIVSAFSYAKENGKNIHFMGLTSNGGVHSSMVHLFKLCDISKEYGIDNTFIHCFFYSGIQAHSLRIFTYFFYILRIFSKNPALLHQFPVQHFCLTALQTSIPD